MNIGQLAPGARDECSGDQRKVRAGAGGRAAAAQPPAAEPDS